LFGVGTAIVRHGHDALEEAFFFHADSYGRFPQGQSISFGRLMSTCRDFADFLSPFDVNPILFLTFVCRNRTV